MEPLVLTYSRSFVVEPSERKYNDPLAAEIVGVLDPKNMPKFAVAETNNPAPAVPLAGIAVPLCAVIDPTAETAFVDAMVKAAVREFCVVPDDPAGATWNTREPPAPDPVPFDPPIVRFAPAVFDVPATTDCPIIVCATGAAASAAPICNVAAAERVRIKSVDHCNADDEPNCVTALLNVFLPVHVGAIV